VRGTDNRDAAVELIEYLTDPARQRVFAENNHELELTGSDTNFKRDAIDVAGAGPRLDDALTLMDQVGWD
jgi:ABC-type Fe3+ transport system substrate-binding protein